VLPTTGTHITLWPNHLPTPNASNLNLQTSQTRPNHTTTPTGPTHTLALYNNTGTVHLIIDLAGYYA
jgi:hypothetical protein